MATLIRAQRYFVVKPEHSGKMLDLGPATTGGTVGTYTIQFVPSADFVGEFALMGRVFGKQGQEADAAFAPVPFRKVNWNGAASLSRALSDDVISGPSVIEVPANGLGVGLLVSCSAGHCDVASWDLNGPCTE